MYTPEQTDKQQRLQFGTVQETKSETLTSHQQVLELENKEQTESTTNISDKPSLKNTNLVESDPILKPETSTIDANYTSPLEIISSPRKSGTAITARHPDFLSEFYNTSHLETTTSPHKSSAAITARHPDFLSEFYNNSRLHHISTAGQELKRYVQHLAENNKEKHFPSREKLRNLPLEELPLIEPIERFYNSNDKDHTKAQNVVMHLDMDCFFVSVGLKKHPELKGIPYILF